MTMDRMNPVGGEVFKIGLVATAVLGTLVAVPLSRVPAVSAQPGASTTTTATAVAPVSQLTTYHANLGRTGYSSSQTAINPSNVGQLELRWVDKEVGDVTAQPAVWNGTSFVGDFGGYEMATSSDGKVLWKTLLGQSHSTQSSCNPTPVGVASSATVARINGTEVVLVGTGTGGIAELNAATGAIVWNTPLSASDAAFTWSSPAVYDGNVYVGIASLEDCPLVASTMNELNAVTGHLVHAFSMEPAGTHCVGDGIWSSPAFEPSENAFYVTTGNDNHANHPQDCPAENPMQEAMIKFNATNLTVESLWSVPSTTFADADWGSTPTVFSAEIAGRLVGLVGSADKNGIFYAFREADLAAGPLWQYQVAVGGGCPQCGQGSISPAAWDGTTLYVAGGGMTIAGEKCLGSIDSLDPATGQPLWKHCLSGGPVVGALTEIPGVVFAGEGRFIVALATRTGAQLFAYTATGLENFWGPVTVSNGVVWAGNQNADLMTFAVPTPRSIPRPRP